MTPAPAPAPAPRTDITHRRVLVTGGAVRIGRAIVQTLAAQGWAVAIHCRSSRAEADALAASLGSPAHVVTGDLADEAQTRAVYAQARDALGGALGAVINNASLFEYDAADTATRESWDAHMETNLRAPFVLSQLLAADVADGQRGAVVNILDQRVLNLTPHFTSYTVSKAALWTLTQTMALGLAPRVRVNAVGPGPTLKSIHQTAAQFAAQNARVPLGDGAGPQDIADAVVYLLSARSVTGQMIAVDGGEHLGWGQVVVDGPLGRD